MVGSLVAIATNLISGRSAIQIGEASSSRSKGFNAMLRFILVVLFVLAGCSKPPTTITPLTNVQLEQESIEFGGETWYLSGPAVIHGDVSRPMNAREYFAAGSSDVRVIEFYEPNAMNIEGVYKRILHRQIKRGDSWVSDGPSESWLLSGEHDVGNYSNGQITGTQRTWYPNGKLKVLREYANDKLNGFGYWENGELQWEATYVNGVEVNGKSYDEDGASVELIQASGNCL